MSCTMPDPQQYIHPNWIREVTKSEQPKLALNKSVMKTAAVDMTVNSKIGKQLSSKINNLSAPIKLIRYTTVFFVLPTDTVMHSRP